MTKKPPASNLSVLKSPDVRRNEACVDMLADALIKAQAGDVQSLALVWIRPDRSVVTASSETDSIHALVGGLAMLEYRLISGRKPQADEIE